MPLLQTVPFISPDALADLLANAALIGDDEAIAAFLAGEVDPSRDVVPVRNPLPIRSDAEQRATPQRLRRIAEQWLQVGESRMLARMVMFRHGGHVRPVITRGSKHLRFRFVSTKTQTIQLGEGKGEAFLAKYNEVAAHVSDYECHPCEIQYNRGNGIERYRPDAVRLLKNGSIELIEVKRTPADIKDAELREKLATVAEIVRLCGWKFRVMYLKDVFGPPPPDNPRALPHRVGNVQALFGRRTMELGRSEKLVAGRTVGRGAPIAWADLAEQIAPRDKLRGNAVIERLLAGGMLSTELDRKFGAHTVLIPHRPVTGPSGIRL
jgi:hypothetical protein